MPRKRTMWTTYNIVFHSPCLFMLKPKTARISHIAVTENEWINKWIIIFHLFPLRSIWQRSCPASPKASLKTSTRSWTLIVRDHTCAVARALTNAQQECVPLWFVNLTMVTVVRTKISSTPNPALGMSGLSCLSQMTQSLSDRAFLCSQGLIFPNNPNPTCQYFSLANNNSAVFEDCCNCLNHHNFLWLSFKDFPCLQWTLWHRASGVWALCESCRPDTELRVVEIIFTPEAAS